MKLVCTTVFICFNHSTSYSNDDFSSFRNSTKARLERNYILSVKFRCLKSFQIYKLSHTALRTKVRIVKVEHVILHVHHFTGKSEQNITTIKPFSL